MEIAPPTERARSGEGAAMERLLSVGRSGMERPSTGSIPISRTDRTEGIIASRVGMNPSLGRGGEGLGDKFALSVPGRIVFLRAREFHLRTKAFDLWFDLRSPLAEHLARFKIFLASISKEEVEQYIDLRLSDRVVYR